MEENLNNKETLNFNESLDEGNSNEYNSIEEECEHYKNEYFRYKLKYENIINENNKLIKERNKLLFQIGNLKTKLKKAIGILDEDIDGNDNNKNIKTDEEEKFDIEKELKILNKNSYHKNDKLNESIFSTLKEETNEQNKILNELNNERKINNEETEESFLSNCDIIETEPKEEKEKEKEKNNNEQDNKTNNKNSVYKSSKTENHPKNNDIQSKKTNKEESRIRKSIKQKNLIIKSILNGDRNNKDDSPYNNLDIKFDEDIISKALSNDFINYERDSLNFRKTISIKETKINTLDLMLQTWIHYSKIIKKGIEHFYKSLDLFCKNLLNVKNDEVLVESPDLLGLIYFLQKKLTDINEHCKSFIGTIDSLFILQLKNYQNKYFNNIKLQRYNLASKISEMIEIQNKFLSMKKNTNKSSYFTMKNNYYLKYDSIELLKFEYICSLNKLLMMIQIELPQSISLLSFSLMVFFRQINDSLKEVDGPIKDNLEKINVRVSLKNKFIENMRKE